MFLYEVSNLCQYHVPSESAILKQAPIKQLFTVCVFYCHLLWIWIACIVQAASSAAKFTALAQKETKHLHLKQMHRKAMM